MLASRPRFMYDSFPQGFGACHTPDNLFPRELIDIAYSVSPTQAIMGVQRAQQQELDQRRVGSR
jgi:hypothetical protein